MVSIDAVWGALKKDAYSSRQVEKWFTELHRAITGAVGSSQAKEVRLEVADWELNKSFTIKVSDMTWKYSLSLHRSGANGVTGLCLVEKAFPSGDGWEEVTSLTLQTDGVCYAMKANLGQLNIRNPEEALLAVLFPITEYLGR